MYEWNLRLQMFKSTQLCCICARRQLLLTLTKYPYYRDMIILPRQLSQSSISRIDDMLGYRPKRTRSEEGLVTMPRNSCRKMSWRFQDRKSVV